MVLDIVFMDGKPQAAVPGGSVFNAMVSLGRTTSDVPVMMVSQIGEDKVSDIVLGFMKQNNVRPDWVKLVPKTQTTVSMAMLSSSGDASYEFFRDRLAPDFEAPSIEFHQDDFVLFGSFFAVDDNTREQTRSLIRAARDAGATVYYDINFRKNHLLELPKLISEIEENCRLASIVRGSSEDVECIWGFSDGKKAYEEKMRSLCPRFIYTSGAGNVEIFWNGDHRTYPVKTIEVVSTIGAGDNFNAGFIRSLLDSDDIDSAVRSALRFSAAVCQSLENYVPLDF